MQYEIIINVPNVVVGCDLCECVDVPPLLDFW
jgi:hypothetical protein